jgi:dUTP pyrophosphatase
MRIKFKQLNDNIKAPVRGTPHSAGIDLRLSSIKECVAGVYTLGLGVAVEIPSQHYGLLAVRSSIGERGLKLTNNVGIIDSDYRGELLMKCTFEHRGVDFPEIGERIAQIIVQPYLSANIEIVNELNDSVRGSGGYGSTNK